MRIGGTRVTLDTVVAAFEEGATAELCTEDAAVELLDKAKKSVNKAMGFIERFFEE